MSVKLFPDVKGMGKKQREELSKRIGLALSKAREDLELLGIEPEDFPYYVLIQQVALDARLKLIEDELRKLNESLSKKQTTSSSGFGMV